MTAGMLIATAVFSAVLMLLSLGLLAAISRQDRIAERLRLACGGSGEGALPAGGLVRAAGVLIVLGEKVARSGLLSSRTLDEFRQTLRTSGFNGPNGLALFVAAKLIMAVGLPAVTLASTRLTGIDMPFGTTSLVALAVVGLLGPDYVVRAIRKRFLRRLERGLPDALDMMVICTEAGLSLEPALDRVCTEIRPAHPEVAEELLATTREMQISADRRRALQNMGARTGLEPLRRLGSTLIQSLQYGTPLSQALRTLSGELRHELLMRFEARAARLPALLTLPMILFILPCLFMVIGGPAVVQVMAVMGH